MPDTYIIDEITTEIPGTPEGVGEDLSLTSVYDEIKHARFSEDAGLSLGVWERDLKKADWKLVEKITRASLKNKTKDLQILAWFIEATVVIQGISGILSSIGFLRSFLESFWTSCYPRSDDQEADAEHKFRILDWIYDNVAKRMLYIPFARLENSDGTSVNLYQYEYAIDVQTRQARSPSHAEEISKSANSNDIKTIDEIQGIISQINPAFVDQFSETNRQIQEEVKNLAHTISKISEAKSFGIFFKVLDNLEKIEQIFKTYAPQREVPHQQSEELPLQGAPVAKSTSTDRDLLYRQLAQIRFQLMEADKHSPSHCLLDLIVSWQDKTLLEVINDLKQGQTPAHHLLRILMS